LVLPDRFNNGDSRNENYALVFNTAVAAKTVQLPQAKGYRAIRVNQARGSISLE